MTKQTALTTLLVCFILILCSCATTGASPNQLYFEAEACYKQLRNHPERQKYRSYWLNCIRKFESVHDADPKGPWAAAGLYMSGNLYREMYKHSYKPSDLNQSRTIFKKVVASYPSSSYRKKAENALASLGSGIDKKNSTEEARKKYFEAEAAYNDLKASPRKMKYRVYWLDCIDKFESAYTTDPNGPWAAAGLFMKGSLYRELYGHSYKPADLRAAEDVLGKVISDFPYSAYSGRARDALGGNNVDGSPDRSIDVVRDLTGGDTASGQVKASTPGKSRTGSDRDQIEVTGIRYWSNPEYTRVVIDVDDETTFDNNLLNRDPEIDQLHQRLYVDVNNSRLGKDIQRTIPIDDSLLKDVRAGQYSSDTVRVVVDIKSFENYDIFFLKNPFRIVIDVRGQSMDMASDQSSDFESSEASIARQLALGVRRIVIDPGHGGKDYGAPGAIKGVHEKHIVLDIAKKLAQKIRTQLGCEVFMTRTEDKYLTLEERTAIANTHRADLFISIHANASKNRNAYGIESYFLNLTTDNESIAVAARENATSEKNISELQAILNDLMRNAKINESSRLATYTQKDMIKNLESRFDRIRNKGVKQAPFYVLLGAQMPAILIEAAFISNERECRRLRNSAYQDALCDGIVAGLKRYIKDTRPAGFVSAGAQADN